MRQASRGMLLKLTMCTFLLTAALQSIPLPTNASQRNELTQILAGLNDVTDKTELAIIYSALSLQELAMSEVLAATGESLSHYDLARPTYDRVTTDLGRTYLLVTFPSTSENDTGVGFTIFQVCPWNDLLFISERGFYLHGEQLINSFIEASKDSSTDYFERDSCALFSDPHH